MRSIPLLVTAIFAASFPLLLCRVQQDDVYDIGMGMADITGPVADIEFWGYATMHQSGGGIHTRLFSRTFIISDGVNRVVLVTADLGSISQLLRTEVLLQLRQKYGDLYTEDNVCISATHTHSAPGGYHQYVLYSIPSMGFIEESFFAIVDGIVQSVVLSHNNMKKGNLYWNQGVLLKANYNRSPTAYLNNPAEERAQYPYDVDKTMYLIKMTDLNGEPIGMINWFPVHGTSMNNTNKLVSSDNKGYAAIKFEEAMNGKPLIGVGPFIAAFAQSTHADTSPNVVGPRCIDTGASCEVNTSTCHGKSTMCVAFGPGKDMFESTKIIGDLQLQKAAELFRTATEKIRGFWLR